MSSILSGHQKAISIWSWKAHKVRIGLILLQVKKKTKQKIESIFWHMKNTRNSKSLNKVHLEHGLTCSFPHCLWLLVGSDRAEKLWQRSYGLQPKILSLLTLAEKKCSDPWSRWLIQLNLNTQSHLNFFALGSKDIREKLRLDLKETVI